MTSPTQLGRPWLDHTTIEPEYTGELNALAAKVAKAYDAEEKAPKRVAAVRESLTLAQEYDDLYEKAQRVRRIMAVPRRKWSDLKDEHPARTVPTPTQDEPIDPDPQPDDRDTIGVNTSTFFDAVMPLSIVTEEGQQRYTDHECAEFTETLSEGEWNELCSVVWVLNERGVGVPKSSMLSRLQKQIGDSQEPPESSESPSPASRAGSRVGGPITTTSTES